MREPDDDEQPVTGEPEKPPEERDEPPQDITMSGGATLPKLGAGSGD